MAVWKSFVLLCLAAQVLAKVQFLGVAIAGGDFGCEINGTCPLTAVTIPLDADSQMKHFVENDGMNMFRLPISWQYLVNGVPGATLDANNFAKYDGLMQTCLKTGAYCMIDIHNFARWDGGVIGQGGPPDDQFVSVWVQLASKYATNDKVVFGVMNEPHHLDLPLWVNTCQKVVTGIRNAGATKQMILLPGTDFNNAASLVLTGGAAELMAIRNPDGGTEGLILDVHKYLDVDNSGTHPECVNNNTAAFQSVADFLRASGRKGLVSETGASNHPTCFSAFCIQNRFINANSDVFLGLVVWSAGSFSTSYVLSLTPTMQNGCLTDNPLMTQCVIGPWLNTNSTIPTTKTCVVATTPTAATPSSTSKSASHIVTARSAGGTMLLGLFSSLGLTAMLL